MFALHHWLGSSTVAVGLVDDLTVHLKVDDNSWALGEGLVYTKWSLVAEGVCYGCILQA